MKRKEGNLLYINTKKGERDGERKVWETWTELKMRESSRMVEGSKKRKRTENRIHRQRPTHTLSVFPPSHARRKEEIRLKAYNITSHYHTTDKPEKVSSFLAEKLPFHFHTHSLVYLCCCNSFIRSSRLVFKKNCTVSLKFSLWRIIYTY